MPRMESLDKFLAGTEGIELRDEFTQAPPFLRAPRDYIRNVVETGSCETELATTSGGEQPGFLRHQAAYAQQEDRYAASKGFKCGKSSRFGQDQIRRRNALVN